MNFRIVSQAAQDVSVVITTYNHAAYLKEAITSVLAQRVACREIIVVDDGSTDSPETVTSQFPDVRIIRQPNQGLSAARNTGLAAAAGEYVLFLDADDRLTPIATETQLGLFARNPKCGFVYGAYRLFGSDPEWQRDIMLRPMSLDPYHFFLLQNGVGMHATVLYRTEILRNAGGFDTTLRACEDYDVYLRLSRHYPVERSAEILADYRQHNSNMSSDTTRMLKAVRKVLDKQKADSDQRPAWRSARRKGLKDWSDYYISQQMRRLKKSISSGTGLPVAAFQSLRLALSAPGEFTRYVARKVARRLGAPARQINTVYTGLHSAFIAGTDRISVNFGYDRGKPLDRRYVEEFLQRHAANIKGTVLEIGDTEYTDRFGGSQVTNSEAFHRFEGHPGISYFGDFATEHNLPDNTFDCMVLTQTLHLIFDVQAAVKTIHSVLKPGGTALITVPWVSPIDTGEWGSTWYWSISPAALSLLLETQFAAEDISVEYFGNVLSASAFLYGLAEHELRAEDLDPADPFCPVIVAAIARKKV